MKAGNLVIKGNKNQIKPKDQLNNIKSKYILKILFDNLEKKKLLFIVKYNKNIKKRINININDYKEYSGKYTSIEIEIKPINNIYGKFININEEDTIYYHIPYLTESSVGHRHPSPLNFVKFGVIRRTTSSVTQNFLLYFCLNLG